MDELQNLDRYILRSQNLDSLHLLLNSITDGAIWLDQDRTIRHINLSARAMLGWESEECLGLPFTKILEKSELNERIIEQLYAGEMIVTDRFEVLHSSGRCLQLALTAIPSGNHSKAISGAILIFRDISLGLLSHLPLEQRESLVQEILGSLPIGILLQDQDGKILRINDVAARILKNAPADLLGRHLTRRHYMAKNQDGEILRHEEAPFRRVARKETRYCEDVVYMPSSESWYLIHSRRLQEDSYAFDDSFLILTTFAQLDDERRAPFHESIRFNHAINRILTDLLTEQGAKETIETALAGILRLISADTALLYYKVEGGKLKLNYSIPASDADRKTIEEFESMEWPLLDPEDVFQQFVEPGPATPKELTNLFSMKLSRHALVAPLKIEGEDRALLLLIRSSDFVLHEIAVFHSAVSVLSAAMLKAGYDDHLRRLALTDSLTGLHNRRSILAILEKEIQRSRRHKHPTSALLLDLDFFKAINDKYGHPVGDEVLRQVAQSLRQLTRKSDQIARFGGEEFLIVLPESGLAGAKIVAEKIRRGLETLSIEAEGHQISTTTSIGCAQLKPTENQKNFIQRLDTLLYKAKQDGRNCIRFELG